jgi:hypothetical protein
MNNPVKIFKASVLLLLIMFLVASCNTEKKMAKSFMEAGNNRNILVFSTDEVFKINQKREILDSLNIHDPDLADSVLYAHSLYLQYINDSLFLANYLLGYKEELKKLGFKVYGEDQALEFLNLDSNAYVSNVAQLEVEETIYEYRAGSTIYGDYYYYDFELNALVVNSWIELKEYNKTEDGEQLYFVTDMITDDIDGDFYVDLDSEQMHYAYKIDTLKTKDLYDFAFLLGRKYAGYTSDWIINQYLDENIPAGRRSEIYWRYDPYRKTLFPAEEDKFIPMDQ